MTCKAELRIGDDHGDNEATMVCDLDAGHPPPHRHEFQRNGTPVVVTFECDERYEPCSECEAPTLKHRYGIDDAEEADLNVGRLQRCKICYAMICETCKPKHLCPCDRCEKTFPGSKLVEVTVEGRSYTDHYCRACIACIEEGTAGGA